MELLRLTGRPRMAVLNNLTTLQKHMPAWQDALSRTFNSVREFNAHRATYAERIKLLQALKGIDQRWEPQLEATIEAFERDWERRIDQTVTTILTLLKDALALKISRVLKVEEVAGDAERERIRERMSEAFQDDLRRLEVEAQGADPRPFPSQRLEPAAGVPADRRTYSPTRSSNRWA